MGVGRQECQVNNVALWTGKKQVRTFHLYNCACVAGTNGISPIFLTTVDATGGIQILKLGKS
jgi:aconitate hydratase 2/2-methylisocitrate dehydratase